MSLGTVRISLKQAPAFLAALIPHGVTFEARQDGDDVVVTFTGGY